MSALEPSFEHFTDLAFANVKTGKSYKLVRADSVAATEKALSEITAICNEPDVYEFLFRSILNGEKYPIEKAKSFLEWATRGWNEKKYYVFVVVSEAGEICAAVDIKSNDLSKGEVGYWASSKHSGVMTPAVGRLCEIARRAGYKNLFAYVKPSNDRSIAVLKKNAFHELPEEAFHKDGMRKQFLREFV